MINRTKYPDKDSLVNLLGRVSLFHHADTSILKLLADKVVFSTFKAGETVIRKGEPGKSMYIIFSGSLKVHDDEHQVALLEKSDFFGEQSLLDSEPRSMSVSAVSECMVGSIDRQSFYEVLERFPVITKDIIAALSNRLRIQNQVLISEFKSREEQLKDLVNLRTQELVKKNEELELAMSNLKKSQQQLVQSEKLASLGQLTAGIAHEIQNPLNFVNNFSQFSVELVEEIIASNIMDERIEIGNDLRINLEKIYYHGKRADSIVKNMLEHSRMTKGEKQLIDINLLCNEFINLAYLGLRASNPDLNCNIEKELAPDLPKIEVASQDISRVFINLFNNAFYAVKNKKDAKVKLKTSLKDGFIVIAVQDNGSGIPEDIKSKIFEPFFTTKPAGEGTGLGLSLSFDIIKSYGGHITMESKVGEGTTFSVYLPV